MKKILTLIAASTCFAQTTVSPSQMRSRPYTSPLIPGPDLARLVTKAVHKQNCGVVVALYDNATPYRNAIEAGWSVSNACDVLITFATPQRDYFIVIK